MSTAAMDQETAKQLAQIERKLEALRERELNMDWSNTTRTQRSNLSAKINELCAERNRLRGLPARDRFGDRSI